MPGEPIQTEAEVTPGYVSPETNEPKTFTVPASEPSTEPTVNSNAAVTTPDATSTANPDTVQNITYITFDSEYNNGNSGSSKTVDWTDGQVQKITLTDDCTLTFSNPPGPTNITLRVIQDGTGGWGLVWPASVKWLKGVAPTITSTADAEDVIKMYYNGTNYYATIEQDFS